MKLSLRQLIFSITALSLSAACVFYISQNAIQLGNQPLLIRALLLSLAVLSALVAMYPFNPVFTGRPGAYGFSVCLPALIPGIAYYMFILPGQAGEGFSALQLESQLITDSSSNGIIEIGFSYPIYTPTISVSNNELFSKEVNIFLRILDGDSESSLFRGVRSNIPGSALSVEASVRGLLSENDLYLFNPIQISPMGTTEGRVVFVISNLEDGTSFPEALGRAYQATFELRDPATGTLLMEFPLTRI